MDKVTQQAAATAEESASASEELNAQAEQMKVFVADLVAIVGGTGNGLNKGITGIIGTSVEELALVLKNNRIVFVAVLVKVSDRLLFGLQANHNQRDFEAVARAMPTLHS